VKAEVKSDTFFVGVKERAVELARPETLLLVALIVASVTRLGWLDLVEFKSDEAVGLNIAASIARGQALPLTGVDDWSGSPYPPFFVYLMAVPELVTHSAAIATGFVGLLDVLAIGATYLLARSLFGRVAGATATLLYAVSPWGIIYSRKVWDQDTLPLFDTLGLFCLILALKDRRRSLILPGVALLTLATQLHPTAYALAAPAAVLIAGCLWIDRQRPGRSTGWIAGGVLAAVAIESPYLAWQARNGWPIRNVVHRLANTVSQTDLSTFRLAASAAFGNGYPTLAEVPNQWRVASAIELALFAVGLLVVARLVLGPSSVESRFIGVALLAWLAAPVVPQIRHSIPLYPHYFIVLYPLPFVLMGVGIGWLWSCKWSFPRQHAVPTRAEVTTRRAVAVGAVVVPVTLGIVAFAQYVAALRDGAVLDAFGAPLGRQEALMQTAARLAPNGVVYLAADGDLAKSLDYLADGRWRVFDDRVELVLPQRSAAALVVTDPTTLAAQLATAWFGSQATASVSLGGQGHALLYRISQSADGAAVRRPAVPVVFEDGLALGGYRIHPGTKSNQVRIDLLWTLNASLPAKAPTLFQHLVDARGQTLGQVDGLVYGRVDWRPGEYFVTQYSLKRPATTAPYDLQVGLYDYPSMQRLRILDPPPGAPTDSIDLGQVTVQSSSPGNG
jgi:4-amino-4-deoxy-L-arabinose transferase-like glycosyltransferase